MSPNCSHETIRDEAFLVDSTLKKLAKWLRVMGYDTACHDGPIDRVFLNRGIREKRVVLSRKKELARRDFRGTLRIIHADRAGEQLHEVIEACGLLPRADTILRRCLSCNELLQPALKADVASRVPPYVLNTQQRFLSCPRCKSVFWSGTHRERMMDFLKRHTLMDRP